MDAGGLAHMSHSNFTMPSGLASRRGGQNLKPLSFDALKSPTDTDNTVPTPRTARGHLLAGLRTAPKTASAATFGPNTASPASISLGAGARSSANSGGYNNSSLFNGPKTSVPRFSGGQQQQLNYNAPMVGIGQHYTADQILAPPELNIEEHVQGQMDPNLQAQLLVANAYLSEQQQRLQQQLMNLQAAAQQFQGLNLNGQYQTMQHGYPNMYAQQQQQQQQQVKNMQAMMAAAQPNVYSVYDPVTGQQTLYVDQAQAQAQLNQQQFVNQAQFGNGYPGFQQQQQMHAIGTPRVQVSPPPQDQSKAGYRNASPPRRYESSVENPAPLPPPSANAFRRGHKKTASLVNKNGLGIATDEPPKSAGPKTASFPLTPLTAVGSYGPGQARAGEHPVRQPRNPPSMDELKAKPTAKHEGSKNFVTRTRRSAIHNLVRAGLERRKEARGSGSTSPISESAEELVETPVTDNDSDSGRSGSGSLVDVDDAECSLPSSRTSTGSWGAIGSDRPSSRQKARNSVDSTSSSDNESAVETGSFASVFKNANRPVKSEVTDGRRKAPMLVLTSADKRKVAA